MGKKRDLANKHIEELVCNMTSYMESYVGRSNCPYKYRLLGADDLLKPTKCIDCESCKEFFWAELAAKLIDKYVVQ